MEKISARSDWYSTVVVSLAILFALYLTSFYSYLLFHTIAEMLSVIIACCIFLIAWNSRKIVDNSFLLLIGVAYLFISSLELTHTMSYKGMGIFRDNNANLPTQLWISARYLESLSLLIAPLFLTRTTRSSILFLCYGTVTALIFGSIFYWNIFPDSFVEGTGLTQFKITSEYIISVILIVSLAFAFRKREFFAKPVFNMFATAISLSILAELSFTLYQDVYGLPNLIGHFLKALSFFAIYKAIIQEGLMHPYKLLFRDLKQSEENLRQSEQRHRAVVDSLSEGIWEIDTNFKTTYVNSTMAGILGYRTDEMIGKELFSFMDENVIEECRQSLEQCRSGNGKHHEFRFRHRDGSDVLTLIATSPLTDKENNYIGGIAGVLDITERKIIEQRMLDSLNESHKREEEVSALLESTKAILEQGPGFENTARAIFDSCKNLIGATAGYLSLSDENGESFSPLFLDSGGAPCNVDPELPMPVRGLRAEAFRSKTAVYENNFPDSEWEDLMPEGHTRLDNVIFAPLMIKEKPVGLIGLANKPEGFTDNDTRIVSAFAELASISLQNSRTLELLKASREELKKHREQLMELVEDRTHELKASYQKLEQEFIVRKAAEKRLQLMALFAELNPAPVLRFNISGEVIKSNPAAKKILGLKPDSPTKLLETLPSISGLDIVDCIKKGRTASYHAEIGGHYYHFIIIGIPSMGFGHIYGTDITEQKRAEAETLRASQLALLGELAAGVAHEVNNPINGIINYTRILANRSAPESEELEIAGRIIKEGNRIADIVKDLLFFARDNKGSKSPVHISGILSDSLALVSAQIKKDGIRLSVNIPPDLARIIANPQQIEQVFLNLISNARYALNQKYPNHDPEKTLEIYAEKTLIDGNPFIRTVLHDKGTGIPKGILENITEQFFSTKPDGKGTGLGLSISKNIVTDHGGHILIESTEGEFTKVTVDLPSEVPKSNT